MPTPALRQDFTDESTPGSNQLSAVQYNLNADRTDEAHDMGTANTTALALKAPLASPEFTGTVTAPAVKITTGASAGKVLTSDADGDGTWETPSASGSAEDLSWYVRTQGDGKLPARRTNWTNVADTASAPIADDTGQTDATHSVGGTGTGGTAKIAGGLWTNTPVGPGNVATYRNIDEGVLTTRAGARFQYSNAGGTRTTLDGALGLVFANDTAVNQALTGFRAAAHVIVAPNFWEIATYRADTSTFNTLATDTFVPPLSMDTTYQVDLFRSGSTLALVLPDGQVVTVTHAEVASFAGNWAWLEVYQNNGTTHNLVGVSEYWVDTGTQTLPTAETSGYTLCRQDSAYTLTSTGSVQKLFNASTNGRVTLPAGVYRFNCLYSLSAMSGTSGNSAFSLAVGTAVIGSVQMMAVGADIAAATVTALSGATAVTSAFPQPQHTGATNTGQQSFITGTFEVTTTGTVIPSIALGTAAAAVVAVGSFFECWRTGPTTLTTLGVWD